MTDEQFMNRALQLAKLGLGKVSPNPMVGCVIVESGEIIGEGYHHEYGGPHAEVNAVAQVSDKGRLKSATVFVSLEPCSHFGKTPPCADLLLRHEVKKVVVCNVDPNPKVAGQGIARLKAAGIDVEVGLLKQEGNELNKRFFTAYRQKRPYLILKWAQTADGFVARENFDSKWISNAYSRQLVHKWRSEEDAVLVGTNTVQYDDPALTTRDWSGKNPVRVFVDRNMRLSEQIKLKDREVRTLCFTEKEVTSFGVVEYISLQEFSPQLMLGELIKRRIHSVIIEGGAYLLTKFIEAGLWDEARVFTSSKSFGKGIPAPHIRGNVMNSEFILNDQLTIYQNPDG